jgi:hypothetical protein
MAALFVQRVVLEFWVRAGEIPREMTKNKMLANRRLVLQGGIAAMSKHR